VLIIIVRIILFRVFLSVIQLLAWPCAVACIFRLIRDFGECRQQARRQERRTHINVNSCN
jgi:hypothetical protein